MPRISEISRSTGETEIQVRLNLDGTGQYEMNTGIGFFDHMLCLLAKHGHWDLTVQAKGDLAVDGHHTVEDIGICLGRALLEALGDKAGINRYGQCYLPMDEALVLSVVDLSGRGYLVLDVPLRAERVGTFETELLEEFLRALAINGAFNLHLRLVTGTNTHHIIEAVFKGLGRSLRAAAGFDPGQQGIPSTKGVL